METRRQTRSQTRNAGQPNNTPPKPKVTARKATSAKSLSSSKSTSPKAATPKGQGTLSSFVKSQKNAPKATGRKRKRSSDVNPKSSKRRPQQRPSTPPSKSRMPVRTELTDDEKENELRQFDLDGTFGPCRGVTRLKRLEICERFKLEIPSSVKAILRGSKDVSKFNTCIWDQQLSV